MEAQKSKPQRRLTLEILACITAALILTGVAYPVAAVLLRWLAP